MSKNNKKEILDKIYISETFPFLSFRFTGANFHLRGDGGNVNHASKERLSCYLRLKDCKLSCKKVSIDANVEILLDDN